jgi:integrase
MYVPKTGSKQMYIRLSFYFNGQRQSRSVGKDWRKAWAEANRIDATLVTELGDIANMTVEALAWSWMAAHQRGEWGQRYRYENEDTLRRCIIPIIGGVQLGELKRDHLRACVDHWDANSKYKRVRALLSSMMHWAESEQWITSANSLLPPRRKDSNGNKVKYKPRESAPTTENVLELARAALKPRHYNSAHANQAFVLPAYWSLMFLVAGFCGLRSGELWALKGKHVDGATLHVREQVQYFTSEQMHVSAPKYGSQRDVYITQAVEEFALRELLTNRAGEVGPEGLLFPSKFGNYVRRTNFIRDVMNPVRDMAWGHRRWVMHDLRHHHCRWLFDQGISIADVSRMAGHQSVAVTMAYYISPNDGLLERIATAFGE